nr:aldo/keto reductase [Altererythrobacter lutimaris]
MGLGAAAIGNLYRSISDEEAEQTLSAAWDAGVRYVDTAPHYGAGLSEARIGKFLASRQVDLSISTKVGRVLVQDKGGKFDQGFADTPPFRSRFDYSAEGIEEAFQGSCERLGVDVVEALFLHDIGKLVHGDKSQAVLEIAISESLPAMADLKKADKTRRIGIGVNEIEACREVLVHADLDLVLLAGRYTLFEHQASMAFMNEMERNGVGVIVGGPFNSGLLVARDQELLRYNYQPAPAWAVEKVTAQQAVCEDFGVSLPAAALAFVQAHPAVHAVVPGAQTAKQLREIVSWNDESIPSELWSALKERGLIEKDALVP